MLTLLFFLVFIAALLYHHLTRKDLQNPSILRRLRVPLIIVALLAIPLIYANTYKSNGRKLGMEEYLEYIEDYYFDYQMRNVYDSYMKRYPTNLELRFRFIEKASDFDFYDDNVETLRMYDFSPHATTQQQSIAFAEAYYMANDTVPANPVKNAPFSNYILGVEKEHQGNFFIAKLYYFKELRKYPENDRAYSALLSLCAQHYPEEYNELIKQQRDHSKLSFHQQRHHFFTTGSWYKYFELITIKVFRDIKLMAFFAALLISILWLVFLRSLDIFNKDKWRDIIIVFLGGAFFTHICLFGYDIARHYLHLGIDGGFWNDFFYCTAVIGLSEETVKLIPWITFLALTKKWKEPYDYLLYASVSALGFAFVENFSYLEDAGNITIRSIMSTVGHMFDASLVAYGFILSRYKAKTVLWKWLFPIFGFIAACLAHGFYDFWLISPGVKGYFFLTIIFFILSVHVWFQFINNAMNNSPYYVARSFNPMIQIDVLGIGFVAILVTEYLLIYAEYGTVQANHRIAFSGWMVPVFLAYITALFSEFRPVHGRWKRFRFRLPRYFNIFGSLNVFGNGRELPEFNHEAFEGLQLRIFVSKSNRHVGDKFPISGHCEGLITVSGHPNWSLFKITSGFYFQGYHNDYVIIRTKDIEETLLTDKVEIILLFIPEEIEIHGKELETQDLRFTGKAFTRQV